MTDKSIYSEGPAYCHYFFDLIASDDLIHELELSRDLTREIISAIPSEKADFSYAANKWTIKELLQHIIDCERIFAYRIFRFSRLDGTELAGFDEDVYVANSNLSTSKLNDMLDEFLELRNSTIRLFRSMTNEMLCFKGRANNCDYTTRAIGFMAVGHNLHHIHFMKNRYLSLD